MFFLYAVYLGLTPFFCDRLIMKGGSMEMSGNILGLKMESNGIRVIEPCVMAVT